MSNSEHKLEELLQSAYRYAHALTAHAETAEDLVHEGWLKVVKKYGPTPDKPLLFRVIRNLYIDDVRHRTRFPSDQFDETYHKDANVLDPSVYVSHDLVLAEGLSTLRSIEREVLFLWVFEGHTAAEIAAMSDQSRGTVLSQIHRAKAKLKRHLDKEPTVQLAVVNEKRNPHHE